MHDASHCNQWFLKNMLGSFTAVIAAFAFKTKDAVAAMRGFCLEPSQFFSTCVELHISSTRVDAWHLRNTH